MADYENADPVARWSAERATLPSVSTQCGPNDAAYAERLREALQSMRSNVAELQAKKAFMQRVREADVTCNARQLKQAGARALTELDGVSRLRGLRAEGDGEAARADLQSSERQLQEAAQAATRTVEALAEAVTGADQLARDIATRRTELVHLRAQLMAAQVDAQSQQTQPLAAPLDALEQQGDKGQWMAQLVQMSSIRVVHAVGNSVKVELLGLERPYTLEMTLERAGARSALKAATISPDTVRIAELVEYCVAVNNVPFLVAQTLSRARSHSARAAEVAAISKHHLAFDEGHTNRLRITLGSGVIASLETAPGYPQCAGSVHLVALDTMGVFPDTLAHAQAAMGQCATLTQAVEALAARYAPKKPVPRKPQ